MILKKRLILFVLALYFVYAFCDDDAFTLQGTTASTKSNYNPKSTNNIKSTTYPAFMDNLISFTSGSESTENPTGIATYESTIVSESTTDLLTTDSQLGTDADGSSSPSTIEQTTRSETTTVAPDVTSTDSVNDTKICDPTWPANASADTREIINLTITDISTEWIALSWEPPCDNTTDVSITYLVERCNDENCNQINETVTWHNATDLDPCTQYTFNVKVLTEFWKSDGDTRSATTDHAIPEIGDVLDLTVHNVSVNIIQLTWQAPVIYAKCISNYSITQSDKISCNETMVTVTNYTANDLKSCTEYHFTVKTLTATVQSPGVNETKKTASPKLSAPQSLNITAGNFSLTAKWQPPEFGTACLKHYHVTVDIKNSTFNTTDTSIIIPDLHACTTYQVSVNAVNEDDEDGETTAGSNTVLRFKTNPPQAAGILSHINSLSIIWSIEKENNHCPLMSIVTTCNSTETKGIGYDPVNGLSMENFKEEETAGPVAVKNVTVHELSPFTSYTCWAYTINTANYSDSSHEVNATTSEKAPSPPTFRVKSITDSQFSLTWESTYVPGNLEEFEITIDWKPLYPIPPWCVGEERSEGNLIKRNVSGTTSDYNYPEAEAFTNYTVWMKAKTGGGWSNCSNPQTFSTCSAVPGEVSRFNSSSIIIKENLNDTNVLDTILTWGLPCFLNGDLEGFNISVHGTRDKYVSDIFSKMHDCADYIHNDYICSINLKELKGEYNYTFEISTKVMHINELGQKMSQNKLYPAGIPPEPEDGYIKSITIDPYKVRRSTTTAAILLPLFPDTNGDIKYYAIMVSEMGYNNMPSKTRFDLTNNMWPNTSSWEEAMEKDFTIMYQATQPKWNPYPDYVVDYGRIEAVKYTIGEDIDCREISLNMDERLYCNGPLKPDTWYHVRMRAFTYGGYTDSEIFVIKTNSELNVAVVIGAIFSILFVGILVTMMLLVRKCSPYIVFRRFLQSDMPGSPVPAPFTRKKFISHCQELVDNPGKLSNEFRLLQTLSVDLQMPTNTACLQANRKKNRYSDILPYDFSRVKLEVIDNDPNTDYINASFIRGYAGEDEYIACQGPKEETTYDFWRMVNQYNINIIVMLTQLVEKGKEKCHQYYPAIRETFRYENMTIRCTSELDFRTHTQRTLVLQKENKKRNIIHLHFKDWPDHDVPEDFDAMINFCQIMRRNISAKGFIVVHCSAGIGRTGTLIAIDILLQQLRDNRKLDVFGTVYRLRHHRINMVQRESQYAYIYNCIKQVLKNPYFLKTYKPPPVDPIYENISKEVKDATNLDANLVNNLEILKKYNKSTSMESLVSIYNLFPWSTVRYQRNIRNSGLRHYKSMDAVNIKTHCIAVGKSRTLECVFYKSLTDSSHELNRESLIQESFPLLTYSKSADILGDSVQYATNTM